MSDISIVVVVDDVFGCLVIFAVVAVVAVVGSFFPLGPEYTDSNRWCGMTCSQPSSYLSISLSLSPDVDLAFLFCAHACFLLCIYL